MNQQITLEEYKKQVAEEIRKLNIGEAAKTRLLTEVGDALQMYLEDNYPPEIVAQGMASGLL